MKPSLILGLVCAFGLTVGEAHAQSGTFGGPRPPAQPGYGGFKPYEAPKPYEPPRPPKSYEPAAPKPFEPFKPFTGVDTNTAPSGLYPEIHRRPKKPLGGY